MTILNADGVRIPKVADLLLIVHPDAEHFPEPVAAIVTAVRVAEPLAVDVTVFLPGAMPEGACSVRYDNSLSPQLGTWHWPGR